MNWAIGNFDGLLFLLRWGHFIFGIAWIGMLWYLNFAQGPFMAKAEGGVKTAITQGLVPKVLFYFRWGAMGTFLTGWTIIALRIHQSGMEIVNTSWGATILTGAIFGSVMWFNVWFIIWPIQKKVIGSANGEKVDNLPAMARRAFLASRTNSLMSIPLLFFMAAASHLAISTDATKVPVWLGFVTAIIALLEINALTATTGITTKPIEKVSGVIHYGLLLAIIFYVVAEIIL